MYVWGAEPRGFESEDLTQLSTCVSGTLQPEGSCGCLWTMTMCVSPHYNHASSFPESLSSVFSGVLYHSRLESPLFSKLAITCLKNVNLWASFQSIVHLIHSEFNDIILVLFGGFHYWQMFFIKSPTACWERPQAMAARPKTHTFVTVWPTEGSLGSDDTSKAA